jgi:hypothetical protein
MTGSAGQRRTTPDAEPQASQATRQAREVTSHTSVSISSAVSTPSTDRSAAAIRRRSSPARGSQTNSITGAVTCQSPPASLRRALFQPHGIVLEEARAVGEELGLPSWWLNEQASSYVAPGGDPSASRVFDHPGLRVFAASPEHLLAMKALAARPRDAEDIRQLATVLNLRTTTEVLDLVREVFPEEEPPPRLRLLLEDIFSDPSG